MNVQVLCLFAKQKYSYNYRCMGIIIILHIIIIILHILQATHTARITATITPILCSLILLVEVILLIFLQKCRLCKSPLYE